MVEEAAPHRDVLQLDALDVEPGARREAQARRLGERGALLLVQPGVHVAAAARLERVDDLVELAGEHPERVRVH